MMGTNRRGREPKAELSRLETEVMDVVWELGECSSAEVVAKFRERRRLAPTTLRTVLSKLREKGYVEPVATIAPALRLRPAVARETVIGRTLDRLLGSLFGRTPRHAIVHLLKAEPIDEAELDEIRALIDARRGRKSR
jgi:predicted transcriptional regulator